MAYPTRPHFASPFSISKNGPAVVQQASTEEIDANVRTILACPVGFRTELPEFGVPPEQFGNVPLDVPGLTRAIQRWEPRATIDIVERALADQQERALEIQLEGD
jgi:phage baseplate assembly protein W